MDVTDATDHMSDSCHDSQHMSQAELGDSRRMRAEADSYAGHDSFAHDDDHDDDESDDEHDEEPHGYDAPAYVDHDQSMTLDQLLHMDSEHTKEKTPTKQLIRHDEQDDDDDDEESGCSDSFAQEDDDKSIDAAEEREAQVRRTLLYSILSALGVIVVGQLLGKLLQRCFGNHDASGGGEAVGDLVDPAVSQSALHTSQSAQLSSSQATGMTAVGTTAPSYVPFMSHEALLTQCVQPSHLLFLPSYSL